MLENGGTFDYGEANLCAHCHHARRPSPPFSTADSLTITSSRWGPHHSMQADVFAGINAYVLPGQTYDNTSPHNNAPNGCVTCHMAPPFGNEAGGHTWRMGYVFHDVPEDFVTGCNIEPCHGGDLDDFSYQGLQDTVASRIESLRLLLVGAGYINAETDLVNASSSSPLTISMDDAGAIFNYLLIGHDRSQGVHNPDYALDVLDASIAFMSARQFANR